jgi:hypothetical protein
MSRIEFDANNLMIEKNLLGLSYIGTPSTVLLDGSFLIPISEISAFSVNDKRYSEQKCFTLLLKNGTTVVVSLDMKNCQKSFDKFIETWKSRFDSKTVDLLDLK